LAIARTSSEDSLRAARGVLESATGIGVSELVGVVSVEVCVLVVGAPVAGTLVVRAAVTWTLVAWTAAWADTEAAPALLAGIASAAPASTVATAALTSRRIGRE
jgi:hypothetical protein